MGNGDRETDPSTADLRSRKRAGGPPTRPAAARSRRRLAGDRRARGPARGPVALLPCDALVRHGHPHVRTPDQTSRPSSKELDGERRRLRAHPRPVRPPHRRRTTGQRRQRRHALRRHPDARWLLLDDAASRSSRPRTTPRPRTSCSRRRSGRHSNGLRARCGGHRRGGDGRLRGSPQLARSYVSEARRRGLGRRRDRIGPIVASASRRSTPTRDRPALPQRRGAPYLGDALGADDRREREPRYEHLFEKYRRPEDYLAVPVEELERDIFATGSTARRRSRSVARCGCCWRSSTASCLAASRICCGCPESPARLRTWSRRSSATRRGSSLTPTSGGSPNGWADEQRGPGQDRARPPAGRSTSGLGAVPASAHLARAPRLRRPAAAVRGVRARRPLPGSPKLPSVKTDKGAPPDPGRPDLRPHDEPLARLLPPEERVAGRRDDPACTRGGQRGSPAATTEHRRASTDRALVRTSGA